MWQKCPICNGTGISPIPGSYSNIPTCPTCQGRRIISEVTGLPPNHGVADGISISSPTTSDKLNKYINDLRENKN